MKNVKKAIAFISALTLMGTVTACGSTDSGTSSTSAETSATTETTPAKELDEEDKAAVAEMDTGDDEKLENGTVKWLSFWDLNPANGKPKSVELELFETKYGGKIEYIPTTYETRYSDLSTQVLGGTSPDLFPAADLDTFPGKAIAGMFEPFDDYLDFDSDLWSSGAKKLSDEHTLGGKHYVAVVSTDAGCVCIYNKKTISENGLPDPAELLAEGNWNWDTFKDMCVEFTDPENKCGIDYSKAVVVDKPEYIDQQVRPHLCQNEYEALRGNEFAVQKGFEKYIKLYKRAVRSGHPRYQLLLKYSTLQNYDL